MRKFFLFYLVLVQVVLSQAKISGFVVGEDDKPLAYVNVYIQGSSDGAMTDEIGRFSFLTRKVNRAKLVASMVGYKKFAVDLMLKQGDSIFVKIKLKPEPIELGEVVVSASPYSNISAKGLSLTQIDIYTTPGGTADIFRTIKTLPGITPVSESAQIYVRGGDPDETKTIIDGASVYHPYTFESPYGGIFSNINTAFIKDFFFSSGGFSAKYGDALSGVLEIETLDEVNKDELYGNVSLAGIGAGIKVLNKERFGFHIDVRKSYTKPIFLVNGGVDEFSLHPKSEDIAGGIVFRYSKAGKVKFFGLFSSDVQGVNVKRPEYEGSFDGRSKNYFSNLTAQDILYSKFFTKLAVFENNYLNTWKLGILDLKSEDKISGFRLDIDYVWQEGFSYSAGFEFESRKSKLEGMLPKRDYDFRPKDDGKFIDFDFLYEKVGIYSEVKFSFKNFFSSFGERFDYITRVRKGWSDFRLNAGFKLSKDVAIKFTVGSFGQYRGNVMTEGYAESIGLKRAIHYIISLDGKIAGLLDARLELYNKLYRKLPLKSGDVWNSSGYGYARGVDIILKGGISGFFNGWISYSFLDSRRKWLDFEELAPSSYDVKHNFSCVLKYNLSSNFEVGMNYKFSTGRPYTPVIGAVYHQDMDIYEPVYGVKNSNRYPNYQRLDLRLNYRTGISRVGFAVFYVEVINVLSKKNVIDYTYSRDYSLREPVLSYFARRTVVFGCFFQI